MKMREVYSIGVLVVTLIAVGCAPSLTVTNAGGDRQYEITLSSHEFSFTDTEDMIAAWHEKASEACHGQNYQVITRDIINREQPMEEFTITGIIECK